MDERGGKSPCTEKEPRTFLPENRPYLPWLTLAVVLAATAIQLRLQGRIWWCACGRANLWAGDIWSAHNSQHLLDPYSFTHVLHGIVFYGLLCWILSRVSASWKLTAACGIEALWEILENTSYVIDRYREVTVSLEYEGDSVVNSMADILCCGAGFLLARRLGFRRSLLVYCAVEIFLVIWIRDSLTLNVLMLLYPLAPVRTWQMAR